MKAIIILVGLFAVAAVTHAYPHPDEAKMEIIPFLFPYPWVGAWQE